MHKQALIIWGGWEGHQPEQMAGLFRDMLAVEDSSGTGKKLSVGAEGEAGGAAAALGASWER